MKIGAKLKITNAATLITQSETNYARIQIQIMPSPCSRNKEFPRRLKGIQDGPIGMENEIVSSRIHGTNRRHRGNVKPGFASIQRDRSIDDGKRKSNQRTGNRGGGQRRRKLSFTTILWDAKPFQKSAFSEPSSDNSWSWAAEPVSDRVAM